MTMHIPRRNQGQAVEISYGIWDGRVYRRTRDRATQSITYATSRALRGDTGDYWEVAPKNKRWAAITPDQFARIGSDD